MAATAQAIAVQTRPEHASPQGGASEALVNEMPKTDRLCKLITEETEKYPECGEKRHGHAGQEILLRLPFSIETEDGTIDEIDVQSFKRSDDGFHWEFTCIAQMAERDGRHIDTIYPIVTYNSELGLAHSSNMALFRRAGRR